MSLHARTWSSVYGRPEPENGWECRHWPFKHEHNDPQSGCPCISFDDVEKLKYLEKAS